MMFPASTQRQAPSTLCAHPQNARSISGTMVSEFLCSFGCLSCPSAVRCGEPYIPGPTHFLEVTWIRGHQAVRAHLLEVTPSIQA
ncbi:hypothetical protein BDR05DRAFT_968027 [Suillus weaverae]|nr:hypothetical protein BDR05DRAFT_968027 [Suillus weaverae]